MDGFLCPSWPFHSHPVFAYAIPMEVVVNRNVLTADALI